MNRVISTLAACLTLFLSVATPAGSDTTTKLGVFSINADPTASKYISIVASCAEVKVGVSGKESYATSSCPDVWFLNGSSISQAYVFREKNGLKVRFTQPVRQPRVLDTDVHIFLHNKYWKVSNDFIRPVFDSSDESELVEVQDQTIRFHGAVIGTLPEIGTPGVWYPHPDLQVNLSDDFHDNLHINLFDSIGTLADWTGKSIQLHLEQRAKIVAEKISSINCHVFANQSSKVDICSIQCDKFDACSQKDSLVSVKSGHIIKASTTELFGGKVTVSARLDQHDDKSQSIPNSQPVKKEETVARQESLPGSRHGSLPREGELLKSNPSLSFWH